MKIGYAKLGRAMPLPMSKWGEVGGDNEPPILLNKLAHRNPEHQFVIVGRNSGENAQAAGFPPNVTNPWEHRRAQASQIARGKDNQVVFNELVELTAPMFADLDAIIIWAGQHGTSNAPIPKVEDPSLITSPQDSFIRYAGYIIAGINAWRDADPSRREIWLCPDARNYLKARDLKHPPPPVISQFDWTKLEKHYRYGDPASPPPDATWDVSPGVWKATHRYEYKRLEIVGIPEVRYDGSPDGRADFGILINEARAYVSHNRLDAMRDYVKPLNPAWVAGKWSAKSLQLLGMEIQPLAWDKIWEKLRSVRCTFTTPSSGSGWATTKPWEAFAVGTVCFFHPEYDTQGHIIPTLKQAAGKNDTISRLASWLRVESPEELHQRVHHLAHDNDTWNWITDTQRHVFEDAVSDAQAITEIEARCGI